MDARASRRPVEAFLDSGSSRHTLGLVYGRRRLGKSTLLESVAVERDGFYWEATRGESAIHLERLGEALGGFLGVGRLALESWEQAFLQLVRLGVRGAVPVVIDEFGYLLEADQTVDSVVASVLGPAAQRAHPGRARLVLCGSAIALMRALTAGQAPLRGRAGLEIVVQPFDYRAAATEFGPFTDLDLATRVHAVIGGAIGYATDMVDHDLPDTREDFDRWVSARVLSPSATLHHEATTLLAEEPTLAAASPTMHHSLLAAIANGAVTAGAIANRLRRSVPHLDPALKRLVATGFVLRHEDPVRARRPVYSLGDPFLQFHYAVLEPHASLLRDRDPRNSWETRLRATFDSRVRGPVFEEQARTWVRRFAVEETIGGAADHVGPSAAPVGGRESQLDVVVAADDGSVSPAERRLLALGEAKVGETVGKPHLRRLEEARASFGPRAIGARLLLFAPAFTSELVAEARQRPDIELIDLDRLYSGS